MLAAVCASLVAAAPSPAAGRVVERGIVQSVGPATVVLRALDGSEVTVAVGPATRVRLNGRAATLAMVRRTGERLRIPVTRATRAWSGTATMALRTLRSGMQVQIVRTAKGAARVVLVLAGPGA